MEKHDEKGDSDENPKPPESVNLDPEWLRDVGMAARKQLKELIEAIAIQRLCMEQMVEHRKLNAQLLFAWYEGLREAGFDDNQAMAILMEGL